MNHRDAQITEVIVVISESYCNQLGTAVEKLTAAGLEVVSVNEDDGVVTGTIETYKLSVLEKLDAVNYTRTVQTYIADFPVGDPRDQDLSDDDTDSAEAV